MKMVIYGAQGIALGIYRAMKMMFPLREIECFLVTEMKNNASTLGGVPVVELDKFVVGLSREEKDNIEVLIGTPEGVMDEIENNLNVAGLYNHVRIDSLRWAQMQQNAFVKAGKFMPLAAYPIGCHMANIQVYKMVHCNDKTLSVKYDDETYVSKLQVGAALVETKIADLSDDYGDNISAKNGNYSELTGLYWMWKNIVGKEENTDRYLGLAHYRRIFELSEDDVLRLKDNDIDVVLPYPMPYEPNVEAHHLRYLSECEWTAVWQALKELYPDYVEAVVEILKQEYLYNYNIFLAKEKILDEYCNWLFPLLSRIEQINDPEGVKLPNRYIGYVGETLETIFFMQNKDKYRIAYAGCRYLI